MKLHLSAAFFALALAASAAKPTLEQAGLVKDPATGLITRAPGAHPTAAQQYQMENTRYGMFIHFGINTFMNQEWTDGSVPIEKYAPKEIAADEWVLAAKNAGMSHVVLVCKHHDGFCNWPTKHDEMQYSVGHASNKTDVVKAVSDACRKHGVRFAVYYSCWDRRWDAKHAEDYKQDLAATHKAYTDYMVAQVEELLSQYGPVTEIWIDGSWHKKFEEWGFDRVYDAVKRHQPLCQVAINWNIGHPDNVDATAHLKEQREGFPIRYFPSDFRLGDPELPAFPDPKIFTHGGKPFYMPFESTICLNDQWFWNAGDKGLKSVDELEKLFLEATAQNNLLLLNSPPGPDGHMRPATLERLVQLRERLDLKIGGPFPKHAGAVKATATATSVWSKGQGFGPELAVDENPGTRWASETPVCAITQEFATPTRIGRVILREYGESGHYRIGKFILEAQVGDSWKTLVDGTTVGASKPLKFDPILTKLMRLRILEASEPPSLSAFRALEAD